jgi:predicted dinucleotide-binding enzyme
VEEEGSCRATLDFQTFDSLTVPADSSAAKEIAAALPHSAVLKAFNTNFAATLAAGTTGEAPATVLIAGDNTQAKALLADVVTAAGLRVPDAGALRRARELEALGFLQITPAAQQKMPWTGRLRSGRLRPLSASGRSIHLSPATAPRCRLGVRTRTRPGRPPGSRSA